METNIPPEIYLEGTEPPTLKPFRIASSTATQGGHSGAGLTVRLRRILTKRKLVILVVMTAYTVLMVGFIDYFSHLVFTKPQQLKSGSLAYAIFISKFIKQIPAFKPLESSEKFYFNIISNSSTPVYIIRFESHAPPEEIISYYRLYFELVNYAFVRNKFDDHTMAIFRNTHEEFAVFVTTGESVNTVSIENTKFR